MDKPELFVTPGYGEYLLKELHYSQAIKIGDRVETSGQGGWDDDLQIPKLIALVRPRGLCITSPDFNRSRSVCLYLTVGYHLTVGTGKRQRKRAVMERSKYP
jgi:hypothetical protein